MVLWTVECHATKVKRVKCQYTRQISAEVNVFLAFYERFRFLAKELCPSDVSLETPLDGSRRLVHHTRCKENCSWVSRIRLLAAAVRVVAVVV